MRIVITTLVLAAAALIPCLPLCAVPGVPVAGATIAAGTGPDGT